MMMNGTGWGMSGWFGMPGLFLLFWLVVILVPFWKIFAKAGFSGWLSLLMVVPLLNLVVLYIVAFSRWQAPQPLSNGHAQ